MASFLKNFKCNLCPNACNAQRTDKNLGVCLIDDKIYVAHFQLHEWEEPVISFEKGSGAVFFSGCAMRCCFCQNSVISRKPVGKIYTAQQLASLFEQLDKTADNVNLVSATPYVFDVVEALKLYRPKTVVWNSSGYETQQTINLLKGYVDIYLPDLKYVSGAVAQKYSLTPNYFKYASAAIEQMIEQVGEPKFDEQGKMLSGVIVRHLVLPSNIDNTLAVLREYAKRFKDKSLFSLMAQYTPINVSDFPEINRPLKPIEYKRALNELDNLGITQGFVQELAASTSVYIPPFKI